jgi:hypothetical protein
MEGSDIMAAPKGNKYAVGNHGGRPLKFPDPAAFAQLIDDFFVHCKESDEKPTIEHMAVFMDTTNDILLEYANRSDEYSKPYQKAKQRCLDWLINDGLRARNPAMHIFLAKNNYGYKDKQEIDTNINVSMADALKQARSRLDNTD